MVAAALAIAAAAATAAAISPPVSAASSGLGPRFTGVGVLLPTVFLALVFLFAAVLEAGVLEGVDLFSCVLERFGAFVSATLLTDGFLARLSDFEAGLGASDLVDFRVAEGRLSGESADFLAAGVADLVTSSGRKKTQILQ